MEIDGDLAEIIGIHVGDGCISVNKRYKEYYLGGDLNEEKDYHNKWVAPLFNKKVMIPLYGKKVLYKEHPKVGIYGFHIFDSKIVEKFAEWGINSGTKINIGIPKIIMEDRKLIKRFLRGLFDTDGNIYFDKNRSAKYPKNNRPVISLTTVSKKLTEDVYNSLKFIGLNPRLKSPYKGKKDKNYVYRILIYRIEDIHKFIDKIGFKNSKHYSKWLVYKKIGYCPPNTKLKDRLTILMK